MLLPKLPDRDCGLRVIAAFLALSFALSSPALALRTENSQSAKVKAGLEEALQSGDPKEPSEISQRRLDASSRPINSNGGSQRPKLPLVAAGAEEQVTVQGPNGPITWTVPAEVKQRLDVYSSGEISPNHILRMSITGWALEEGLLISALNRLSDPTLASHSEDRDQLAQETLSILDGIFMDDDPFLMETWWYLVVHLLVLEQRLEQATPRTEDAEAIKLHLGVIRDSYRMFLNQIDFYFVMGKLPEEPKKFYEERLLNLAASQRSLGTQIGRLLQNWDEWTHSTRFDYQVWNPLGNAEMPNFDPRSSKHVVEDAGRAQKLAQQLLELQTLLTPNSEPAAAFWDHPAQSLANLAKGSPMIILAPWAGATGPQSPDSSKIELPNAWLFQLGWLDEMGSAGFRRWAFTTPQHYLGSLLFWGAEHGDRRTYQEFAKLVQEYLESPGTIPFRTFLGLPNQQEPSSVTQSMKFLEELRTLRQKYGSEVKLFFVPQTDLTGVPSDPAFQKWVDQSVEKPMLVLGQFAGPFEIPTGTVQIHQWGTAPHYKPSSFFLGEALEYAAHQVGMDRGWGDHESAAVWVGGNKALRDTLVQSRLPNAGINNSLDALVFSSVPDEKEKEEPWSPETEAAGLREPQELVPVGPAAGAEEEMLAKAIANPEVSAGLKQQGWAEVSGGFVAEANLSTAESLVLQKGLKQPEGLPTSVPVIWADETTVVGMIHYLSGLALQGGYNVAFSAEYFDLKDAQAAVPLSQPMPGSVLLSPGTKIRANELGAAFVISKRTGTIYVIGIVEFTSPNWKKPLLYLRVQA